MLIERTNRGLYCRLGDFYIDPWQPVEYAVITHAHSDHARWRSQYYLTSEQGIELLRQRLGKDARIEGLSYGEKINRNGVQISLHPAGHILGSSQVRLEHKGEVCVVAGDYKTTDDGLSTAFELMPCHTFVSESTFGLPIYRWKPQTEIFAQVNSWWRDNQSKARTSVLFAYALGKAQRLLAGLDGSAGPIFLHGAVSRFIPVYERAGVRFPSIVSTDDVSASKGTGMVIAPPSADHTPWLRRFGECSKAFASGWMQLRGTRRRRGLDRGFVLSDHADWDELLAVIRATGAEKILVTHGYTSQLVRWLRDTGLDAQEIATHFEGEAENEVEALIGASGANEDPAKAVIE